MKKILLGLVLLFAVTSANAEYWAGYKHKTYIGGYYAAVSYACLNTRYTNNGSGYWHSEPTEASVALPYERGCALAIWKAMFGDVELPK